MYEHIGGAVVVSAVVDRLYTLIDEDVLLRRYFARVDMTRQKRHMVALLSQVLGGPRQYKGRDLAEAHRSLGISGEHYEQVGNYLLAALLIVQAPHDVIDAVTEVLAGQRDQIVGASGPSHTGDGGSGTAAVVWPPEVG